MIRDTLATFTTIEKTETDIQAMIATRANAFFVAADKEQLVGFVTFGPFRSGPGYAKTVELSIVVSPAVQGRRIGENLMAHAERAARQDAMHVMIAAISSANDQAFTFHQKVGFVESGRMPEVGRKSEHWLDLILMQKILN